MFHVLAISFGLVFIRAMGMIVSSPVLGEPEIPARVYALLSFILALVMFPWATIETASMRLDILGLALLSAREFAIGAGLGIILATVYAAFRLAGQAAGQTMGIAIANVVNPLTDEEFSLVGEFWYFASLAVFIAVDGHLYLVRALQRSFEAAPVGRLFFSPRGIAFIGVEAFQAMFVFAVRIALPVVAVVLLAVWGMGVLGRMVPQMHVFLVGFPLMLLSGLLGLYLAMPLSAYLSDELLRQTGRLWNAWIGAF